MTFARRLRVRQVHGYPGVRERRLVIQATRQGQDCLQRSDHPAYHYGHVGGQASTSATAKLQDADRAIRERTQAILAKTDLPEGFVQTEYQRLTDLAERGEDDPHAPEYFSPRRDE